MGGLSRTGLGFLTLVLSFTFVLSATAQVPHAVTHSDSSHYSYLKFSLFPFIYEATRPSIPYLWISLQYESQFLHKKQFTYNVSAEYISIDHPYTLTFDGLHKELAIRPQVRFYPDRKSFKGYYFGLFPIYFYSGENASRMGHYWGGGAITGYQFFVRKKIPIELNIGMSYQTGGVTRYYDEFDIPHTKAEGFWRGTLEANIGFPIRKKR